MKTFNCLHNVSLKSWCRTRASKPTNNSINGSSFEEFRTIEGEINFFVSFARASR